MSDTNTLIAALENAPGIIIPLIREVPPQYLKRRPSPAKWSAYEHACHIATPIEPFLERLELILSTPAPFIRSISPSPAEESGALLNVDLDEALDRYVRERADLVKRLKELSADDWQRTAEHEAFRHYSVWIMFRHVLNHEMLHTYRIEELLLKKDWE
jgi:hypothetical protein